MGACNSVKKENDTNNTTHRNNDTKRDVKIKKEDLEGSKREDGEQEAAKADSKIVNADQTEKKSYVVDLRIETISSKSNELKEIKSYTNQDLDRARFISNISSSSDKNIEVASGLIYIVLDDEEFHSIPLKYFTRLRIDLVLKALEIKFSEYKSKSYVFKIIVKDFRNPKEVISIDSSSVLDPNSTYFVNM
jgi:hypothetical protein